MLHFLDKIAMRVMPQWLYGQLIKQWDQVGLRKYAENTFWALSLRIANTAISFLVTISLIRYLGPEHYGQLSYATAFVGLFSIIAGLGIESILYRDLVQYPEKRNVLLGSAFAIRLFSGLVATMSAVLTALFFSQDDVSRYVIIIVAGTFILNSFQIIITEFQAQVAQKYISLVSLGVVIILNVLKVTVILIGEGIPYLGVILLFESILYAIGFVYIRFRHYGSMSEWRLERSMMIYLLKESWPFVLVTAFTVLYMRIDQVMLKYLLDSSAVGLYDAAVRLAEVWLFIPTIIVVSLFPAIVNARKSNFNEYRKRLLLLTGMLAGIAVLIAIVISFLAKPIILILYGTTFVSAVGVLILYAWAGVWSSLDIVAKHFLLAEHKQRAIFYITGATAILNILLNFLLIPAFGIIGAAWSTLIAYIVLAMPLVGLFSKKAKPQQL